MSDQSSPSDIPSLNSEQLKQKAEEIFSDAPPEVKEAVEKSRSFYRENRDVILSVGVVLLVLKINKRMTRKVVTSVVQKDSLIIKEHLNQLTRGIEDLGDLLGARPTEAWASTLRSMKH